MKLISLNIEGSKHLERWIPFVQTESPDVLCLQEVFITDLEHIAHALQMRYVFMPTMVINRYFEDTGRYEERDWGIAMFYKDAPSRTKLLYYTHDTTLPGKIPLYNSRDAGDIWKQAVILCTFPTKITIATTHFAWTTNGESTDYQKTYMNDLINVLGHEDSIVLCGDLNAPRGLATWAMLDLHYKDNVPPDVTSTLDPQLHKVPGLQYVVDAFFTSPSVNVKNVRVVEGVSDHQALIGEMSLF